LLAVFHFHAVWVKKASDQLKSESGCSRSFFDSVASAKLTMTCKSAAAKRKSWSSADIHRPRCPSHALKPCMVGFSRQYFAGMKASSRSKWLPGLWFCVLTRQANRASMHEAPMKQKVLSCYQASDQRQQYTALRLFELKQKLQRILLVEDACCVCLGMHQMRAIATGSAGI